MYFKQKICKTETFHKNNMEIHAPNLKMEGNFLEGGSMLGENFMKRLILGTFTFDLAIFV